MRALDGIELAQKQGPSKRISRFKHRRKGTGGTQVGKAYQLPDYVSCASHVTDCWNRWNGKAVVTAEEYTAWGSWAACYARAKEMKVRYHFSCADRKVSLQSFSFISHRSQVRRQLPDKVGLGPRVFTYA